MSEVTKAVWELVAPTTYEHEGGINGAHTTVLASRLDRLERAIGSSIGSGGRSGGSDPAAMNMLDSDALFKSLMIKTAIVDWCVRAKVPRGADASKNLIAWHDSLKPGEDRTNEIRRMYSWVDLIDGFLDRREEIEITEPCTACNEATWVDANGDEHPNPVRVTYRKEDPLGTAEATCNHCDEKWTGEMAIRSLRWAIGQQDTK